MNDALYKSIVRRSNVLIAMSIGYAVAILVASIVALIWHSSEFGEWYQSNPKVIFIGVGMMYAYAVPTVVVILIDIQRGLRAKL